MNIAANVSARAEKVFTSIVENFNVNHSKRKVEPFHYEISNLEDILSIHFNLEKTWISRIYKLKLSYSFPVHLDHQDKIIWNHKKKEWVSKQSESEALCHALNSETTLKTLMKNIDIEDIHIILKDNRITINLVPIPGCFVWTLVPPMHYFVKLKSEEYTAIKEIFQLTKSTSTKSKALVG